MKLSGPASARFFISFQRFPLNGCCLLETYSQGASVDQCIRPCWMGLPWRDWHKQHGPLLWNTAPVTDWNQIQQPFSRIRLVAPRLHLRSGSNLRPCLVAPTIDDASLGP